MEKNENMNQDSLTSMKEFKKKNIQSNICIHKICILLLTIINITHIIFLIIYKIKLKKIKRKISLHRSIITPLETKIKRSNALANKKIVNVASQTKKCYFSFLFETIDEINTIKNLILSKKNIADETIKMQMIYQSRFDGDNFKEMLKELPYSSNILFLIKQRDSKFGFFFENGLSYRSKDVNFFNKNCFIFSFQNKEIYDYIGDGNCFRYINNEIIFGKNDVIISNNYLRNNSIINFPFQSFDVRNIKSNEFTKSVGIIIIEDIEIYKVRFK